MNLERKRATLMDCELCEGGFSALLAIIMQGGVFDILRSEIVINIKKIYKISKSTFDSEKKLNLPKLQNYFA